MNIDYRCIFCFLKSYRRLFEKFNILEHQQKEFLNYFYELIEHNSFTSTPEIQRELNIKFNSMTAIVDSFAEEKSASNKIASELYNVWKPKVMTSNNPFELALRLSIAGNIMDYGAKNKFDINETIEQVTTTDFAINHTNQLKQQISRAKSILFLGDNAGEIVFDKLFIETINHPNVTYAVKGSPIINDVTVEDAKEVGMDSVTKVISNGYDVPSTVLKKCSAEFLEVYLSADLIISKGQGNLEGLIVENDPRIYFLLMVKCDVIAEALNVEKGSFVVVNQTELV